MPIEDGHGYSKYTHYKQWRFGEFLGFHANVACAAAAKAMAKALWLKSSMYYYIDLTAGKGYMPKQQWLPGSPVIAAGILSNTGVSHRIHLYEREPENAGSLRECFETLWKRGVKHDSPNIIIHPMSYEAGLPVLLKDLKTRKTEARVGLAYYDPTSFGGTADLHSFLALIDIFGHTEFKYMDVLLHIPATTFKRVAAVHNKLGLMHYIEAFPKNFKYISRPTDRHQWTFFYLTNTEAIKPPKFLESVDSVTGSSRVRIVSNSVVALRRIWPINSSWNEY